MQVIPMTAKNRKEAEPVFCQVAALRYAKVLNELGISKEAVLEAGNIFEKSQGRSYAACIYVDTVGYPDVIQWR